ncbi:MAG: glutamate--tRNA ligase [Deltaproteobacteria bacterium]|nr:glutamate--tRNA ligase [Candidatus Zymogenaceae bacterium]
MSVRVRFAPSPTGSMHLGNARTAVLNALYARAHNGRFILRIEDTDTERFVPDSESRIVDDLDWLGIIVDEGPDIGGDFGPYRQSERHALYREYAEGFLKSGIAYRCFCTDEELAAGRKEALDAGLPPRYPGTCRGLSPEESEAKAHLPHTLRFRVCGDDIVINDLIHGEIVFRTDTLGDFIIIRQDKSAVYNFSAAVDDHLMKITHIIRGEDHLPNTPRQVLIYRALGADIPSFAHHPLLLSPTGEKLAKREGTMRIGDLRNRGVTPEAVCTYLAAIGSSNLTGMDPASLSELAGAFSFEGLGKSGVKIDEDRIMSLTARHIHSMSPEDLAGRIAPFLVESGGASPDTLSRFAAVIRDNLTTLKDAKGYEPIFFREFPEITDDARKLLGDTEARSVIERVARELSERSGDDNTALGDVLKAAGADLGVKGKRLYGPVRAALTGMVSGPELDRIAEFIGDDLVRRRLERALALTNP